MKTFIIGVFNGFDVDDYYINAESVEEAISIASAYGEVYCVVQ